MLARLIFGLVLGLIMYMPRPTRPESGPPGLPPGADEPPTPGELPDGEPPLGPQPVPLPPIDRHPRVPRPGPPPGLPPTPPPGFDGEWPPASERPDAPPTPPPGHHGEWPPRDIHSLFDRIVELLKGMSRDGAQLKAHHAAHGAEALAETERREA